VNVGFFAAYEEYDPATLLEHATLVEEAGFDTVWISDHVHP